MTLQDLCKWSGKQLADLTDDELNKFFEENGYYNVTRPDRVVRKKNSTAQNVTSFVKQHSPEKQKILKDIMGNLGIDLTDIMKKPKGKK